MTPEGPGLAGAEDPLKELAGDIPGAGDTAGET